MLGGEFRPHFLRVYCEEVPRDFVPADLIAKYGDDASEVFYRVKVPPTFTLADEPPRTIPARVIPAQPERGIPEKRIPPQHIRAVKEVVNHMWTNKIFPSLFL